MQRRSFSLAITSAGALLALLGSGTNASAAEPAIFKSLTARQAYELAATGQGFTVGPVMAANTVYVFFDSTCPHCAHLWESAKPLKGKLKMVWMPVGLLRQQSAGQGATILSSADPVAAMSAHEASVLQNKGGITPTSPINEDALAKVKANSILLGKLGATSVPLVLYKNARTGEYGAVASSLETTELATLTGIGPT